jgi:uncharacterized protein (DUF305 family)
MAKHIALDQQAQIDTLQGLLQQWGEPAAPDHMGHDGMGMDGMVDAATMDRLPALTGTEFDELWLRSMITHHQGAVANGTAGNCAGENPTAVKMAGHRRLAAAGNRSNARHVGPSGVTLRLPAG